MKTEKELLDTFMGQEDDYDEHGVWRKRNYKTWNELMPVMTKAKQAIKDAGWGTPAEKSAKAKMKMALNEVSNINIENAYFCIVKFIQWYNDQEK